MTTPKKTTKVPAAAPTDEPAAAPKPKRPSRKRATAVAAAASEPPPPARTAADPAPPPSPVELAAMLNAALHVPVAERAAPAIHPAAPPAVVSESAAVAATPVVAPADVAGVDGNGASAVVDAAATAAAALLLPLAERVRAREGMADLLVFRVGGELFGAALTAIEEALELPQLSHLPEMPPSMLGVISLRGRMLPAYSPARPLGVALARADAAALVVRAGERRIALAVDDVDDVLTVDLGELRPPPIVVGEERDAVLLGVANRGADLVSVLDADALVTACLLDQALEIA